MPSKYVSIFDEQEQIEYMSEIEPIFSLCSYNTQKKNSQAFTKRNEKNTYIYDVIKEMGYVLVCKKFIILYISLFYYTFVNHSF